VSQRTETRQTQVVIFSCDLCGSEEGMARYQCNRCCKVCGRTVCSNCQDDCEYKTRCKICGELAKEWLPKINAAYLEYERMNSEWKAASLGVRPSQPPAEKEKPDAT